MNTAYGAVVCVAAVAVLVPIAITYAVPFVVHAEPPAPWFQDVAPRLAPGTVLLTLPYPTSAESQAMAWQADTDFVFSMVGGYAIVPGRDGRHSIYVDPPDGAPATLVGLSFGVSPEPIGTLAQTSQLRQALRTWGVQVVVVARQGRDPLYALGFLTAALGREPLWQDGVWVWYGLGSDRPLGMGPLQLFVCSIHAPATPLGTPSCVLGTRALRDAALHLDYRVMLMVRARSHSGVASTKRAVHGGPSAKRKSGGTRVLSPTVTMPDHRVP